MGVWFALHRGIVDGIGIDAILGMSVWIVLSCGRVPLGNTAFAAVGALVTIDLAASHRWPVVPAALAGVLAAAFAAYVLGFAVARLGAVPFAVATLAFGVFVSD